MFTPEELKGVLYKWGDGIGFQARLTCTGADKRKDRGKAGRGGRPGLWPFAWRLVGGYVGLLPVSTDLY